MPIKGYNDIDIISLVNKYISKYLLIDYELFFFIFQVVTKEKVHGRIR